MINALIFFFLFQGAPDRIHCKPSFAFKLVFDPSHDLKPKPLHAKKETIQSIKLKKTKPENCFILKVQISQETCDKSTSSSFSAVRSVTRSAWGTHVSRGILYTCSNSDPGSCLCLSILSLAWELGTPDSWVGAALMVINLNLGRSIWGGRNISAMGAISLIYAIGHVVGNVTRDNMVVMLGSPAQHYTPENLTWSRRARISRCTGWRGSVRLTPIVTIIPTTTTTITITVIIDISITRVLARRIIPISMRNVTKRDLRQRGQMFRDAESQLDSFIITGHDDATEVEVSMRLPVPNDPGVDEGLVTQ